MVIPLPSSPVFPPLAIPFIPARLFFPCCALYLPCPPLYIYLLCRRSLEGLRAPPHTPHHPHAKLSLSLQRATPISRPLLPPQLSIPRHRRRHVARLSLSSAINLSLALSQAPTHTHAHTAPPPSSLLGDPPPFDPFSYNLWRMVGAADTHKTHKCGPRERQRTDPRAQHAHLTRAHNIRHIISAPACTPLALASTSFCPSSPPPCFWFCVVPPATSDPPRAHGAQPPPPLVFFRSALELCLCFSRCRPPSSSILFLR